MCVAVAFVTRKTGVRKEYGGSRQTVVSGTKVGASEVHNGDLSNC